MSAGDPAWQPASVRSMFDRIAPTYDLLNHLLSFNMDKGWRRKACRHLPPGGRVLDLCGGTGDFGRTALPLHGGGDGEGGFRKVLVLDFSLPMLSQGRKRGSPAGLCWAQGDALSLPFADQSFNAITCGFGMRNLGPHGTARGLAECARVLRPGGRLLVLEFFPRPGHLRRFLQRTYLSGLLPTLGGLISGDPGAYGYLARTMEAYLTRTQFESACVQAGLPVRVWQDLTLGVCSLVVADKTG